MLINFSEEELTLINFFHDVMSQNNKKQTIYFCGGFVRDKLLKLIPSDIDVVVHSSIYPILRSELYSQNKFPFMDLTEKNKTYGTKENVKMMQFFYNNLKVDIKVFEYNLYEDLKERDFTINSLYYNIWDEGINDLVGVI
jgi:tRNA nucleotidyltransferase/poly(A) polymerase